ncbi:hypothetical protein ACQKDB_16025 [Planococcus kocurii]|uniref:hypothetical protein n=1 Tax=Planococcus kocurii TaxID=1374 RepID=UPI003D06BB8D
MIDWKRVDPKNPPKDTYIFFFDGYAYTGWTLDELDDKGYPVWEANENGVCHGVRYYTEFNYPEDK